MLPWEFEIIPPLPTLSNNVTMRVRNYSTTSNAFNVFTQYHHESLEFTSTADTPGWCYNCFIEFTLHYPLTHIRNWNSIIFKTQIYLDNYDLKKKNKQTWFQPMLPTELNVAAPISNLFSGSGSCLWQTGWTTHIFFSFLFFLFLLSFFFLFSFFFWKWR